MEFDCTKEGKNIYFACREKAAKYNDLLNSRERAAELLGISTSTLANHELGVTKNVPPDTVVMMSDLYKTQGIDLGIFVNPYEKDEVKSA